MNTPAQLTELEMIAMVAKIQGIPFLKAAELVAKCDAVVIMEQTPQPPPKDNEQGFAA